MATTFAVPDGRVAMAATLWTGDGTASRSIANTVNTVSFQPDLIWVKQRNIAQNNELTDSVRGAGSMLASDAAGVEYTATTYGQVTAFGSTGFTASKGSDPTYSYFNINSGTYVGWQWKAGGTAVSNTAGTITSSVSANTTAGFSIVVYTGNGTNGATVGHGLGAKPSLIIEKGRSTAYNWSVQGCGVLWTPATSTLFLNTNAALNISGAIAAPTTSVFTPSVTLYANESGVSNVAYCWAPVAGYSAFGSYTGNGSTDGPFIYTGFRPRYFLTKRTDATNSRWIVMDTSRAQTNVASLSLWPNASNVEYNGGGYWLLDFLSNGFKIRGYQSGDSEWNVPGANFIYAAFAENPLKYSNAR